MSKRSIEVCILSARGLKRSNPLWKLKTLCVAWIYPEHKYCSNIDKSGDTHPAWNMKFSAVLDAANFSGEELTDAAVCVEVHSREPVFHFVKLECAAKVMLKEFIANADAVPGGDYSESASFQLRTPAGKPRGMVDVAIRVSRGFEPRGINGDDVASTGKDSVVASDDENDGEEKPVTAYPANLPSRLPPGRPESFPPPKYPYGCPPPMAAPLPPLSNSHPRPPPQRPPPYNYNYPYPPPPSADPFAGSSFIGLPGPRPAGGQRPGQGMLVPGLLAGGAAGGMLFGMDGLSDAMSQFYGGAGGHLTVSTDPLWDV